MALCCIGIIGAFTLTGGNVAVLFGLAGQRDPKIALTAVPIALWEFSLGHYLTFFGFHRNAINLES